MNVEESVLVIELQIRGLQLLMKFMRKLQASLLRPLFLLNKVQASECSTLLTTEAQSSSITNLEAGGCWALLSGALTSPLPWGRHEENGQGCSRLEDFLLNAFSVTRTLPAPADIQVSDEYKAGATLLFSRHLPGTGGVTFTIMG